MTLHHSYHCSSLSTTANVQYVHLIKTQLFTWQSTQHYTQLYQAVLGKSAQAINYDVIYVLKIA